MKRGGDGRFVGKTLKELKAEGVAKDKICAMRALERVKTRG